MSRRPLLLAGSLAIALFVAAFVIEALHFARFANFYLHHPVASDGQLYFATGRAWLNGFRFYRDIFETKPPGVFMLAAWSIRLGGGYPLYVACQLLLLALLIPSLTFFAYVSTESSLGRIRIALVAMSVLLGATIAVEGLARAWGYQAEGFGLLFAVLPALLFALPLSPRWKTTADGLAGVSLGFAAMFKEPLAASGIIALMVFCVSRRDVYRLTKIMILGGFTSIAILILTHAFSAYFSLYLPEIFVGRPAGAVMYPHFGLRLYYLVPTPIWIRSLNAYAIFSGLATPAWGVLLPLFFATCLVLLPPLRGNDLSLRSIAVSFTIVASLLFAGHEAFVLHQVISGLHATGKQVPWTNPIILRLMGLAGVLPVLVLTGLVNVPPRLRPSRQVYGFAVLVVVLLFAAMLLVSFGGGAADLRYQIFAFPPLLAVAMYSLIKLATRRHFLTLGALGSLLIINATLPGRFDFTFGKMLIHQRLERPQLQAATELDELLVACNESRYFMANGRLQALAASTHHSPYQIAYGIQRSFGAFDVTAPTADPNPYLAALLRQELRTTRIIVAAGDDILPDVDHPLALNARFQRGYSGAILTMDAQPDAPPTSQITLPIAEVIRQDFTTVPPGCARGHFPIYGLQVFFRSR